MEEEKELKELKEGEAVKVKKIELIKPRFVGPDGRYFLKLKTETGEERIAKISPHREMDIRGNFKIEWGFLIPEKMSFTFEEPVPALFYEEDLLIGKTAEEIRLYLEREQKKLKEAA
ncbi:MAG: hypothetical protein ACP5F8_02415 [Candidatus Aenigmatarchaeota archaeon]